MCYDSSETFTGNKTLVCTVGDLKPGQQFRTQDGTTILVTNLGWVEVETGRAIDVDLSNLNLGRDRAGRLYASRSLNPQILEVEEEITPETTASYNDLGN